MALNDFVQLSELGAGTALDTGGVLSSGPGTSASNPNTGDLRRKYNFGDRVSELAIAQDPFFRFVSKVAKKPTDDPTFKFTEKRGSYHKRYGYVTAWQDSAGTIALGGTAGDADLVASNDGGAPGAMTVGDDLIVWMATDYKSSGNLQNVFGQDAPRFAGVLAATSPQSSVESNLLNASNIFKNWNKM